MKKNILLFCILFLGLFLRLYGNNWDQGWHLHPDERFLTMVGVDVKIPPSLTLYLDQNTSSFNPVKMGHAFYVYGTLPILLNKVLARYLYNDTYDLFNLQGRVLSGVADFLIVILLFKLLEMIEKKLKLPSSVKYVTAFFYSISVLPIQLSHFFAVDTFLNLFCWLSLYFAVRLIIFSYCVRRKSIHRDVLYVAWYTCLSGFFLGLAFACKISAIYFAPLVGVVILFGIHKSAHAISMILKMRNWVLFVIGLILFLCLGYIALRLGSPYYFETNNIFNFQLSTIFMNSIQTLKSFDNPQVLFPPANQWIHASPFLSITNLIFFGVGPFYFFFSAIGFFLLLIQQRKNSMVLLIFLWIVGFIILQSIQFAKTMRYLIFVYPFLAFFAAFGMHYIIEKFKKFPRLPYYMLHVACYILILLWPLAFMSIYTKNHSRIEASQWIYTTIPNKSVILSEYWDDPLPLMVQDLGTRNYVGSEVHIFDTDTKEKWQTIDAQLKSADYYIMSSNRGWASILSTPERYPIASQFYLTMLQGRGSFTRIREFSSYPSLRYLGIPIDFPDQWAEEAFTVYDHPLIYIFKKNK